MTRQVFIRAGRRRQTFQHMPDVDARHAEKEGWGLIADDPRTDARSYSVSDEPEHTEKADAYFNRNSEGYQNRQLEAAPSPPPHTPATVVEPDGGVDAASPNGKTTPPKGTRDKKPAAARQK
ncbi:MAG TPA: hypothetical protein VK602_05800 [Phyllobacterium sp.]|nr:hypothetical protein [Phyllobacterium sp.]